MVFKFKFKGTDLSEVVQPGDTQFGNFIGLTYSSNTTANANSRPNTTGYQDNGTDLAITAMAHVKDFGAGTHPVVPPSGAKAFHFIGVGGGGGSGGGGGGAIHSRGTPASMAGGYGGTGGTGGWVVFTNQTITTQPITVTVGGGGGAGGGGGQDKAPSSRRGAAQGGSGTPGTKGGDTYWETNTQKNLDRGNGGSGGNGGTGGRANSGRSGSQGRATSGNTGAFGTKQAKPSGWTYAPGTPPGGSHSPYSWSNQNGQVGDGGGSGSAQFIWLYG